MKEYTTDQIRNIALVSHNGAGTTTFVERLLFNTKVTSRMGSVQNGSAALDFEEEEIARQGSISMAMAPIIWKNTKINVLDTPGYADFIGETNSALHVAEGALVFVEGVSGVEVGTEIVWQSIKRRNLPKLIVVSKMDRDNVRVARAMTSIEENLDGSFVQLQLPIGEGASFKGVVDLLAMECRLGDNDERAPIPDDMVDAAEAGRLALVEAAAEGDDELLEKYFEEDNLTDEEIVRGLKAAMLQGQITPVIYCAQEPGIAMTPAMNAMVRLFPSPAEFSEYKVENSSGEIESRAVSNESPMTAFVFKTREDPYGKMSFLRVYGGVLNSDTRVWDANLDSEVRVGSLQLLSGKDQTPIAKLHAGDIGVVVKLGDSGTNNTLCEKSNRVTMAPIVQPNPISQVAISPETQSDVAKMSSSLSRLTDEDLTLKYYTEPATRQTILAGMGTTHLDIAIKKAKSKFGINLTTAVPKIPYRETITKSNSSDYTHKKQTGGAGQYGRVFLRLESLGDEGGFEFGSEIFGGSVSAPFVAATEKGCRQALEAGPIAGFPVVGVKAVIYDGKEHPVDSKEIAFQTAGRECFKQAMLGAGPQLLEPIYSVEVTVPADNMGDIMGDFNTRRATILGMDQEGTKSIVKAEVPLAEMQSYTADLRSMTQGRGVFSMEFKNYGRVPSHLQDKVAATAKAAESEE
ncbi:MAG: elongation factor G [Chloroflexota bacterium]